jgi:hypothetical protein
MLVPEPAAALYKFGEATPDDHPCVFPNVWAIEKLPATTRMVIAPEADHIGVLMRLLEAMPEPMGLLYVLVVPRGGGDAGRYQSSEPQSREQVLQFLSNFRGFLQSDGRHNLWIRSQSTSAMLVYDRHNLIYGYGPLDEWMKLARQIGLVDVSPTPIEIPSPHSHHDHSSFDVQEQCLLAYLPWLRTPLRDQDKT